MKISIIVPFYNEEQSVRELHERLLGVMQSSQYVFEIIFVDDGSKDGTFTQIKKCSPVIALRLRHNYGQTQALAAGIREAQGDLIITLDGDLENDPADIPALLAKLEEGYDVVSGWRKDRWHDSFFTRRLPSALANRCISVVTGVSLHDHGCTLKAYRRRALEHMTFSGDMHRMIAAYAAREGARLAEIPVHFTPRKHGKSHYGLSRTFKVLLDIFAFHFFYRYARRPIHFFGGAGFASLFVGCILFFSMLYLKYHWGTSFIKTPLPVLIALFVIIGFQFILMGLLAEIITRTARPETDIVQETLTL
ncbi:MAG: glycosyltransferase [Candidatus Ryanbacteria bacterium]|nr:glycosyltransferase [Candidatus Ryanbacteria bacterium]